MRFLVLWCFLCFGWSTSVRAASYEFMQRECAKKMADNPPQIVVEYSFGKLSIDTTKNADELIELAHEFNPKNKNTGNMQGLTGLKFATKLNIETLTEEIGKNDVCMMPQTVRLKLYYENPTIYIINELKPKTCRYNLVLRHEYAHLDIGHTALKELAAQLKQRLTSVVMQRGSKIVLKSIYRQDSQALTQKFLQEYESGLKPLMNNYKEKLLEEQAQLDTPENYKRESALCP